MKKTNSSKWRVVFNARNSTCSSCSIASLHLAWEWCTESLNPAEDIYIHAEHRSDGTTHKIHPKTIEGYRCIKIGTRWLNRVPQLCWIYDANLEFEKTYYCAFCDNWFDPSEFKKHVKSCERNPNREIK